MHQPVGLVQTRHLPENGEGSGADTILMEQTVRSETIQRWYTRPVFFVADVNRALRFYVDMLGFEKRWHEGDGAGKVCQVDRGECQIILCKDGTRRDRARLFVELTADGLAELRREVAERSVPSR